MKAIGMYIFSGSQTIGHLLEGWDVNTILEMTDDMLEQNAHYFKLNYPEIEVKLPSEYENNESYLNELKDENYDLLFSNPPCSGLSSINRNAKVDNDVNKYLYNVFKMVDRINPKAFLIENAPTLTTTGLPILKDMIKLLSNYRFTIINDIAGNHNVAMHRRRTFIIGWNRDNFSGIPKIVQDSKRCNIENVLNNIDYSSTDCNFTEQSDESLFKFYDKVEEKESLYVALSKVEHLDDLDLSDSVKKDIIKIKDKINNNKNIWDKSPYRPKLNDRAPSLASVVKIIHPIENRDFYVREYAALMGYPNDFKFTPRCKTPIIQCIAQGVPVNFIRYISKQIKNAFSSKQLYNNDIIYINQCNPNNIKLAKYSKDKFYSLSKII